jgi:hypothetical protein
MNENGLVCQGVSTDHGKSATWFTCDEYMKPSWIGGERRVPEVKSRQLRWRISDFKDGDYTAGSTMIYNSSSKGQSDPRKGFYSAKLEIVQGVLGSE